MGIEAWTKEQKTYWKNNQNNSMSGYHFIKNAEGKEDRYKNIDEFGAGDGI